ncbi:hypothetical protein LAZ67_19001545 [Cordylochernes scorpioides]|uniref:SH2 domain-containing protein n=1 Tax=Cordylochernes scorpioides TaxID=51811 RepID=A0ABY6LHS5_9ARAC|nr:hypothetical protein LAZ67_19001545 [Cordylochernes scorpioides]
MPPTINPFFSFQNISLHIEQAEALLVPREEGLFLVRESTNYPGDYTLCVVYQDKVEHYRVMYTSDCRLTIDEEEYFTNLSQLVEHYQTDADGLCTKLEKSVPKKGNPEFTIDTKAFELAGWTIKLQDLQLGEVLGKGEFGEVEKMILANRQITVREVAEDLNISIGSCHSIFINDLGMRWVAAKFVPKLLNCDQKQHCMNIANEMLDSVRDDPNLLQRVITGDKAWVYGYDVETKAQSSQWKLPHEPRPKKARQVRSNVKVLLTIFFDCRGVVHHEFLPQGRTVNKEYYLQVMRNLCEAIRQKRPDLWKNKNWLLHHLNAPAHTSLLVRDFLAKTNTLMIPQPPYSPDLAPCDFFLFPKLKRPMKGRRYATLDEIKTASKEELKKIFKNDFLKCLDDWKNLWHKCIISHGDYFEGDKIGIHE